MLNSSPQYSPSVTHQITFSLGSGYLLLISPVGLDGFLSLILIYSQSIYLPIFPSIYNFLRFPLSVFIGFLKPSVLYLYQKFVHVCAQNFVDCWSQLRSCILVFQRFEWSAVTSHIYMIQVQYNTSSLLVIPSPFFPFWKDLIHTIFSSHF